MSRFVKLAVLCTLLLSITVAVSAQNFICEPRVDITSILSSVDVNVGLDIGVISRELFAMMVLMALATTFMTTPLVSWLLPASAVARGRGATAASSAR